MKEVWKKLEEDIFQGRYYISNLGRVKRIKYDYYLYGIHKRTATEKILKPKFNNCGYLYILINYNNKMYNRSIHRLVAENFIPNPKNLPQIDHIDGNKENNKVDNLEWVTAKENMRRFYCSDKNNQQFNRSRNNKAKNALDAKKLVEQKTILCEKNVFIYNGKVYNKIHDIFEDEDINYHFKNYRECWSICTREGRIKKQKIRYYKFLI